MRVVAFLRLGFYFARCLWARLVAPPRGLLRFRQAYEGERLYALAEDEREAVAALSKCIACGLCDVHFGHYPRVARVALRGPSDFVLGYTRPLPDWDALVEPLAQLERGDLERIERLCPAQVPFERVARTARRRAVQLRAARTAGGTPVPPRSTGRHDPG